MSFAEGFGESFSKSFNAGVERNAQEREDQFKMIYEEYLHRRQMYDEQKIADTKLANQAKALVQTYGGTVPPEAWAQVYNWKVAGLSDDQIADNLHRGKFNITNPDSTSTQSPPDAQNPSAVTATPSNDGNGGGNSMNPGGSDAVAQTSASGLTGPKPNIPPSGNGPVPPVDVPSGTGVGATPQTGSAMDSAQTPGVGVRPPTVLPQQVPIPTPTPPAPPPSPHVRPDQTAPLPGTLAHAAAKTLPVPAPQAPTQNMSNDMSQSLSQVTQSPTPAAPGGAPQGAVSSNPIRGFFDRQYNDRMAHNTDLAKSRISNASGLPTDQVNQIMTSVPTPHIEDTSNVQFTPGPVRDKADEQETLDSIGQGIAVAQARGDQKQVDFLKTKYEALKGSMADKANIDYMANVKPAEDALVSKLGPTIQAHKDSMAGLNNAVRDYVVMDDAIKKTNGTVLNTYVAQKSDQANVLLRDVTGSAGQLMDSIKRAGGTVPEGAQAIVDKLTAYQQKLTAPGGNGLDNLAVQRGLFETQAALFAFHLAQAASLRGGNRGLSVEQLDTLKGLATNSLNPDEFHQNMANLLGNVQQSIDTDGVQNIQNDTDVAQFRRQRGYSPPTIDYDLLKAQDQKAIQGDPELNAGYQLLNQYSRNNPAAKTNQPFEGNSVIPNTSQNPRTDIQTPDDVAKLPKGTPFIIPGGPNKGQVGYAQ